MMRAAANSALALSPREAQAMNLLSKGHTNKEIARTMFLSENTIKYHLKNIYRKMLIGSRVEAAQLWSAALAHDASDAEPPKPAFQPRAHRGDTAAVSLVSGESI